MPNCRKMRRSSIGPGGMPAETATGQQGFTLIEVLAALAVFAIAALALLDVQTENTRAHIEIRDLTLASIAADNHMVELLSAPLPPDLGEETGETEISGLALDWEQQVSATNIGDIRRITVKMARPEDGRVVAEVTAFRGGL